jgi:hypothetical protein
MTMVWSYSTRRCGRSEAPLNWRMGAKVMVLTEEARSAVALWRKINGDGSALAIGAGQADSPTWGSCSGFLLTGRSGRAQGNRRGGLIGFFALEQRRKREGEGERRRLGHTTQRRRGGDRGVSGVCGALAGGRVTGWASAGGSSVGQKRRVGRLFGPGPMKSDIFDLFENFQMAQIELIKRGPSRSRTNSNKIWI